MKPENSFTVKEFLWRQKVPVDPMCGLTLFATLLEDDMGRRLFVYADGNRMPEAFEPDGTPIAVSRAAFTTEEAPFEKQAYAVKIGGDALPSETCQCVPRAAAGVKVCAKMIGGQIVWVTCPPYTC